MTRIDPSAQLAALIRSQVASLRQPPRTSVTRQRGSEERVSKGRPKEGQDIATLIAQRVQVIDANDPQRERKAFRIFLESVLLAELGDELANDPAFYSLVDNVQQQMEKDPELAASIAQAAQLLLSSQKKISSE